VNAQEFLTQFSGFSKKILAVLILIAAAIATGSAQESSSSTVETPVAPTPNVAPNETPGGTAAKMPVKVPEKPSFFARWGKAYLSDWTAASTDDPAPDSEGGPKRRGTPAPIASPPFPASDWPIGGTQEIGAPDYGTYPLQTAIDGGDPNKLGRAKWYGWIAVGANGSTNNRGNAGKGIPANLPSAYDEYPNTVVLDQLALYYERLADTVQTDHFDWGFRLSGLYGQDYRFTTAKGMLSQQLLVKNAQYGFDPVMMYVDLYFPKLGQGADLRIGRYISLPDIEAQLAPNNYTQTGANLTVKINSHWTVQGGLSAGCDVMPWTTDAKPTGNVCVVYTWSDGGNALNVCDNTMNDANYAYNNLTAYYATWYHRISPHWHTDTEAWYQYMLNTPNMWWYNTGVPYNPVTSPWPETTNRNPGASTLNFGAVCENPSSSYTGPRATRCFAPEWAVTNYIEHNFRHNTASLNIRNELVDDIKGQRTGTPGLFEEHMVGFDFWAGSTVTFRPEVSYVRSYSPYGLRALDIAPGASVAALSNAPVGQLASETMRALGAKTQSLTVAADIIWHF
jgi:hypothetical protein